MQQARKLQDAQKLLTKATADKKVQKMLVGKKPAAKGRPRAKCSGKAKAKKSEAPIEDSHADAACDDGDAAGVAEGSKDGDSDRAEGSKDGDGDGAEGSKDDKKPSKPSLDLSKDWAAIESWFAPITKICFWCSNQVNMFI